MIQASLYKFLKHNSLSKTRILICANQKEAQKAYEVVKFFCLDSNQFNVDSKKIESKNTFTPLLMNEFRLNYGDDVRSFFSEFLDSMATLNEFYKNKNSFLIAPIYSIFNPLPKENYFKSINLKVNEDYDLNELKNYFLDSLYEVVDVIEMEGEVSFRGDIIDVYPPNSKPIRISFFDSIIEDIKEFDISTQLSNKDKFIESININPAFFYLESKELESIKAQIEDSDFDVLEKDLISSGFWFLENKEFLIKDYESLISKNALNELNEIIENSDSTSNVFWKNQNLNILDSSNDYRDIDFHLNILNSLIANNEKKQITILCASKTLLQTLNLNAPNIKIIESNLDVNVITPNELIISLTPTIKKAKKRAPKIAIDELNIGEYVVHQTYGIGVFKGIVQNNVLNSVRDFVLIAYQGEDKLLLPVENLHLIDRYIASSGGLPIVDRLGKGSFLKLKEKARTKLFEIADMIIKLAAKRNLMKGQIIDSSLPEIFMFKNSSGFKLTADQERSINEIFSDMSSGRVMDRLLSGDVGFGKTEVAMNAIFACYKNNFQSALVVPTTLLCSQHFETLKNRFSSFEIIIEKLDRFTPAKEKTRILNNLKEGKIDVLIGTHSVLGVEFNNLGLLVIDEEHKFGVKQKEALKKLTQNVHLLSMSATPIPRTLNMALSQIKGMSRLEIAPESRQDSKTFVKHKSDALLKEVINRELRRAGQVFYLHNHIASLQTIYNELKDLLPNLNIAILHSQIPALKTEEIMNDFALKKYQVLLCTSIIESGIHIPNANTIIVDGADKFGLADLHQLRGRVGRGEKVGYCYFLVEEDKELTQNATKRLLALERNSYLGSGASIAYHDLEIRGGGNLIGENQSGHINNIGYSLYLNMLEEAINTLSGNVNENNDCVELKISVSAYLNPELIASDKLRLELYRRLSLAKSASEVHLIEEEINNRFGALDSFSLAFLRLILIKILANEKNISQILHYNQNIQIRFKNGDKVDITSPSKDDDDVLDSILGFLRK